MESARSRKPGNFEEIVVKLARAAQIHRIEIDYTYFVNNNPFELSIEGLSEGKWIQLVPRMNVKPFAGNVQEIQIQRDEIFSEVKVHAYPCGGMNRLKVFSR